MLARLARGTPNPTRIAAAISSSQSRVAVTATRNMATAAQPTHASSSSSAWRRRVLWLGLGGASLSVYALASHVAAADEDADSSAPLGGMGGFGLQPALCAARSSRSDWPPPLLSHAQIYSALSGGSLDRITPIRRGMVASVHTNQYAANPSVEDSFALMDSVAAPPGGMMMGVFDGHSGGDASRWAAAELLPYLVYYRWSNRTDALLHRRAFLDADHAFLELALRDKRLAAGLSGACVTVAHVAGRTVRTANAGDCRTIIGRRVSVTRPGDSAPTYRWQAVELTTDHQIDTNPLERERLLRDHPDEHDVLLKNRVKGRLQPTRGLGDGFYKRKEFYSARSLSRPYASWTPPYTTAEPDITEYELQSGDSFLVQASDGLFQDLSSAQVVSIVGEWMDLAAAEEARKKKISLLAGSPAPLYTPNAATYLIRAALLHASEHAVGRRRKENEGLSWILQLPAEAKRSYHDDVTVAVAFFDQEGKFPADGPAPTTAAGPPVPPTLARALALHIKPPPQTNPLPTDGGIVPIKIAPIHEPAAEPIRANL